MPGANVFSMPVDPVAMKIPDYPLVVKHPMDLGTVRDRLANGYYKEASAVDAHVRLTFDNAMKYNQRGSLIYSCANKLRGRWAKEFSAVQKNLQQELGRAQRTPSLKLTFKLSR